MIESLVVCVSARTTFPQVHNINTVYHVYWNPECSDGGAAGDPDQEVGKTKDMRDKRLAKPNVRICGDDHQFTKVRINSMRSCQKRHEERDVVRLLAVQCVLRPAFVR